LLGYIQSIQPVAVRLFFAKTGPCYSVLLSDCPYPVIYKAQFAIG